MKTAMIFAAGLGTRLRPLTDRMPKALVRIGDRPLLRIVLDRLVSFGYDHIVVNVHHFASMIEEYLASVSVPGVTVSISDETDLLRDTGGGILHAERFLGDGRFLVHNVDIISDLDLGWLDANVRHDAIATLAVSDRKTSRYLLRGSPQPVSRPGRPCVPEICLFRYPCIVARSLLPFPPGRIRGEILHHGFLPESGCRLPDIRSRTGFSGTSRCRETRVSD